MKTISFADYHKLSRKEKDSFTGIISWNDNVVIMQYVKNGKTHRDDGPAIIYYNGQQFYYIDGREFFSKSEWEKHPEVIKNSKEFKDFCLWQKLVTK